MIRLSLALTLPVVLNYLQATVRKDKDKPDIGNWTSLGLCLKREAGLSRLRSIRSVCHCWYIIRHSFLRIVPRGEISVSREMTVEMATKVVKITWELAHLPVNPCVHVLTNNLHLVIRRMFLILYVHHIIWTFPLKSIYFNSRLHQQHIIRSSIKIRYSQTSWWLALRDALSSLPFSAYL